MQVYLGSLAVNDTYYSEILEEEEVVRRGLEEEDVMEQWSLTVRLTGKFELNLELTILDSFNSQPHGEADCQH